MSVEITLMMPWSWWLLGGVMRVRKRYSALDLRSPSLQLLGLCAIQTEVMIAGLNIVMISTNETEVPQLSTN